MAWLAVDKDGSEYIYEELPERSKDIWDTTSYYTSYIKLPKGSIKKLIGKELTWDNRPVEI